MTNFCDRFVDETGHVFDAEISVACYQPGDTIQRNGLPFIIQSITVSHSRPGYTRERRIEVKPMPLIPVARESQKFPQGKLTMERLVAVWTHLALLGFTSVRFYCEDNCVSWLLADREGKPTDWHLDILQRRKAHAYQGFSTR